MPIPKETIADVRRAYRLIWGYQRRVMDILRMMADEFDTHEFYYWTPLETDPLAKRGTNPLKTQWAWDALPFYKASFLYKVIGSDHNAPMAGQWLLELSVDSDDVDFDDYRGEPDASRFPSAQTCNSTISLIAWQCTNDIKANWFNGVWETLDWPDPDGSVLQHDAYPVRSVQLNLPIEELDSQAAIKKAVADFRNLLKEKLEIGHSLPSGSNLAIASSL